MIDASHRLETFSALGVPDVQQQRRRALFAVCFGFFLVLLDTTALNVATPALGQEFGDSISDLQWVVNSYTLVFASLLLMAGALGDRAGVKRSYQVGLALFTGASLLSAVAPSPVILIMARAAQGFGAAIMLPASLAILSHTFPNAEARSHAVSVWANTASLGFAAGPVLGGLLTACLGWRTIFWLNVPVGIAALWFNHLWVKEAKLESARRIDWAAQITLGAGLLAVTYGLIEAGRRGWTNGASLGAIGFFLLTIPLFVFLERRSDHPVLPAFLFSKPTFSTCVVVGFVLNFSMYGILFMESIYLQKARALGALGAGLLITPFTLFPTIVSRLLSQKNGAAYLRSRISLGFALAGIGSLLLLASTLTSALWPVALALGILGVSMGSIMPAMTAGVLVSSGPETAGLASGVLNSARQVGGTVGVALLGTIMGSFPITAGFVYATGLTVVVMIATAHVTSRTLARPDNPHSACFPFITGYNGNSPKNCQN
ncbi:MAG: MFS transporter [Verrucomicrobia bacterium]|nr:MFS transporter [Verrucomicrobiota bacterium]